MNRISPIHFWSLQVAGAVAGSLALMELMPKHYHHMLDGPALKVDVQTGAIAEGVLTFVITFMIFVIVLRGPESTLLKNLLLTMVTLPLVLAGSNYTGPSMNPANVSSVPFLASWNIIYYLTFPCCSFMELFLWFNTFKHMFLVISFIDFDLTVSMSRLFSFCRSVSRLELLTLVMNRISFPVTVQSVEREIEN